MGSERRKAFAGFHPRRMCHSRFPPLKRCDRSLSSLIPLRRAESAQLVISMKEVSVSFRKPLLRQKGFSITKEVETSS